MSNPKDEEPDRNEVAAIMREARSKSRGYATYWEWAPDRSRAEVGVAQALADYLTYSEGASWASVTSVRNDPPDVLLLSTLGVRIGVEVTELVDAATVERHRHQRKIGASAPYDWAHWTAEGLAQSLGQAIERKDRKLAQLAKHYDEIILAIATDEPEITLALASEALRKTPSRVANLQRAFLLLSYHPAADKRIFPSGVPVLPLPLERA